MIIYVFDRKLYNFEKRNLDAHFYADNSLDISETFEVLKTNPKKQAQYLVNCMPESIKIVVTNNTALASYLATFHPYRFVVKLVGYFGNSYVTLKDIPVFDQCKYLWSYTDTIQPMIKEMTPNRCRANVAQFGADYKSSFCKCQVPDYLTGLDSRYDSFRYSCPKKCLIYQSELLDLQLREIGERIGQSRL